MNQPAKHQNFEETHISQVYIGPRYTYKVKKPVCFRFIDYSTLAKRKHFCQEEVRLNRRYSPGIYLGVVRRSDGEYAVKMKTLPAARRLDRLLKHNQVSTSMILQIAKVVWGFHRRAKTIYGKYGQAPLLKKAFENDFRSATPFINRALSKVLYHQIHAYLLGFISNHADWLKQRRRAGKIRDLHGDLYSENIFFLNKPYLFDCIEFNYAFRYVDCAAEISFLLMDLELRGKNQLAKSFLAEYLTLSQDLDCIKLLNFYKCHYAFVRGVVHCLAGQVKAAKKFFQQAGKYSKSAPALLAVGGIIGTGKSTLSKKLANEFGAAWLRSDAIRKKLAGIARPNLYSPAFSQKTYRSLFKTAEEILCRGKPVVLDASFSKKTYRTALQRLAQRTHANLYFIETNLPDKLIRQRLARRRGDISDAGPALLKSFKKNYEPPRELPVIKAFH